MLTVQQSHEWQDAAMWQAKRGLTGKIGDPLPENISHAVAEEITNHPDEWQREVRAAAYFIVRMNCSGRI